jgi:uncharacterized membrane protein
MRLIALAVVAPIAVAAIVALVWLWPRGDGHTDFTSPAVELNADVVAIEDVACPDDIGEDSDRCGTATLRLDASGGEVKADLPRGSSAPRVGVGDHVVVIQSVLSDGVHHAIVDHQRSRGLWVLAVAFAAALIAFGRWRGVTALVGLAVTFGVLLLFVVPAILEGRPPLLVAMVASAVIMVAVLYLTHGFSLTTTVAFLGTLASFALTGLLSAVAVAGLHLTGVTDDVSMSVEMTHHVDMAGLLLAGIVIGSLGVLDDVTVTQAVTVAELARANPGYGAGQLFRAGGRVGRSHIASVVNTIVLAYGGASLPVLILTVAGNSSLGDVVTTQFIAQEIVRSGVATLGLVAAVPLTTGLAALVLRRPE